MSTIHSPSWIETVPLLAKLQPDKFDWVGWCEYVKDLLPVDVYYTWHICTQPALFDYATEALYWDPMCPLTEFDPIVLQSMESLGAFGYQRNYMALCLCAHAAKYSVGTPAPGPLPEPDHMHNVSVFPVELEERIVQHVAFGYLKVASSLIDMLAAYVQQPDEQEWSCIIPLSHVLGVKSNEIKDGTVYEHTYAVAQENAREVLTNVLRLGMFTRKVRPRVRLSEIQSTRRTCMQLHLHLPQLTQG